MNRIGIARAAAVQRQSVPGDRRIRLKEKPRPGFGSGSISNSQGIDPSMPRRLSSGPFDSLLPARLQQSHHSPTSVAPNIFTIVRNGLWITLLSAATAAEGEATLR